MTAPAGLWRQGDEEPERPLRLPVPAYLIETESERILVDTGLHPDATTDPKARYGEERLCELRAAGATVQPGHDPDGLRPGPVTA